MKKEIPNESPLDDLRICKFCGRVFKDGETEMEIDPESAGIKELCPYCKQDQSKFNGEENGKQ